MQRDTSVEPMQRLPSASARGVRVDAKVDAIIILTTHHHQQHIVA